MAENEPQTDTISSPSRASPASPEPAVSPSSAEPSTQPMSQAQADQILAELKGIQQKLVWLFLIAGFFAARSFFFHY
ncbi:MAG: hypothetical protein HC922_06810 [Leptolyngbyaceae cyanobacterium SM2_3_12]|nr:hypothetical protein [Leptolyngbyaceae cyanobacterium SM2_3_12]